MFFSRFCNKLVIPNRPIQDLEKQESKYAGKVKGGMLRQYEIGSHNKRKDQCTESCKEKVENKMLRIIVARFKEKQIEEECNKWRYNKIYNVRVLCHKCNSFFSPF